MGKRYGYNPKFYEEEKKSYVMSHKKCGYVCEGEHPPGRCPKCGSYSASWTFHWNVPEVVTKYYNEKKVI